MLGKRGKGNIPEDSQRQSLHFALYCASIFECVPGERNHSSSCVLVLQSFFISRVKQRSARCTDSALNPPCASCGPMHLKFWWAKLWDAVAYKLNQIRESGMRGFDRKIFQYVREEEVLTRSTEYAVVSRPCCSLWEKHIISAGRYKSFAWIDCRFI